MHSSTCIIPVVGSTDGMESTLLSVLERRPDDCEVIVVLSASYDDPFDLQNEIQFIEASPKARPVDCINLGIAAATTPIVHVLASGLEAGDGWLEKAAAHFANPKVAAVSPVIFDTADPKKLLAAGVGYLRGGRRSVCRELPNSELDASQPARGPLLIAGSYRKSALAVVGGGIPTDVGDQLADLDLALTLSLAGWQIAVDPNCHVRARSINETSVAGFKSGMWSERLFWRHANRCGLVGELMAHPMVALTDTLRGVPLWMAPARALGRLMATCQFGHYAAYRQVFNAAQSQAALAEQSQSHVVPAGVARAATAEAPALQRRVDPPHQKSRSAESRGSQRAHRSPHRRSGS